MERKRTGLADPSAQPNGGRRVVTTGLLLSMAIISAEATVVTTALPTVIGELKGLELYPWVYSAYLLTSTMTVPIYGKLADLYGRKPIFLAGIALFLLGSVLCGLANSMPQLVLFRALQGLGAGAVMPLVFTIIGDIYPLQERGKVQGFLSGVWGIASVAGPALGAFLTVTFSWRYVFFVGVPLGLVGGLITWRAFNERVERRQVAVDYAGAATISAGLLIFLLAVLEGGRAVPWTSPLMIAALVASLGLFVAFVRIELRAPEPVLPLSLFRHPIIAVAAVANLIQGAQLFGLSAYVPLFVQSIRGETAAGAGRVLTPLLIAWSISGYTGPKMLLRFGFRGTALFGTGMLLLGSLPLLWLDADTPDLVIAVSMALLGLGFGPSMAAFMVAVQAAVPWQVRGVATSTMQLCRSLGGTVGVALLGALLTGMLVEALPGSNVDSSALLNPAAREALGPGALASLQAAATGALHLIFVVLVALALVSLSVVVMFARGKIPQSAERVQREGGHAKGAAIGAEGGG